MAAEELVVEGELDLTEADLAAVTRHLPEFKRRLWLPLLMLGFMLVFLVTNERPRWFSVLPVLFALLLVLHFQRRAIRSWPRRALADLGEGRTRFRFDDFGFSASSSLRQHRLAWAALARYVEAPDSFVMYTTPRTLLVVPKRAFSAAQLTELSRLLRARVPGQAAAAALSRQAFKRVALLWLLLVVTFVAIWLLLNDAPAAGEGAAPGPVRSLRPATERPPTDSRRETPTVVPGDVAERLLVSNQSGDGPQRPLGTVSRFTAPSA